MIEYSFDIKHGDCTKLLPKIAENSVDLILTDPPYNLGKYSTGNIDLPWRASVNNDIAEWDSVEFKPKAVSEEFVRILKPDGNLFIFTSYNLIGKWHEVLDPLFDTFQFMVWHKTNPTPRIFKKGFLNSCELIVCCWNKGNKWNFGKQNEMHNFIETGICMGKERIKNPKHPTQKPVKVLKHIIQIASDEGDIVFDPFMGVGSTGDASLQLNRKFLGFELDKSYYIAAKDRLKQYDKTSIKVAGR